VTGESKPRSQYLFPAIAFALVWLPGSIYKAWQFGRRVRLTGPGSDSITPFIDHWTQSAQAWLGPAFFAGVTVFVFERWLEDRAHAKNKRLLD
jgi:hypothetical protein